MNQIEYIQTMSYENNASGKTLIILPVCIGTSMPGSIIDKT